ncbi:MAG: phospholipase [Weeksellaceae bacterium]|nr:phospholipase [Weeksellaceae bacterium]
MKELAEIQYLERRPKVNTQNPKLMLLIHGYGSNEEDLFGFADAFPDDFHVVSLRATHTLSPGMYAWYEINFLDSRKFNNIPQGIESRNKLVKFIDEFIQKENCDKENVWICGFSQGAILSYSIALNYPEKVKHISILSGYPEKEFIGEINHQKDFSKLNFFISHGTEDPVIPVEWARKGKPLLDRLNIQYQYNEYYQGHGLNQQNYNDFMNWVLTS